MKGSIVCVVNFLIQNKSCNDLFTIFMFLVITCISEQLRQPFQCSCCIPCATQIYTGIWSPALITSPNGQKLVEDKWLNLDCRNSALQESSQRDCGREWMAE